MPGSPKVEGSSPLVFVFCIKGFIYDGFLPSTGPTKVFLRFDDNRVYQRAHSNCGPSRKVYTSIQVELGEMCLILMLKPLFNSSCSRLVRSLYAWISGDAVAYTVVLLALWPFVEA